MLNNIYFRNGHTEVIEAILEKDKVSVKDKDEDDNTPLHLGKLCEKI